MLMGVKTVTITSKGQIAIPKEVRKIKGFREGERIALLAYEDRIELKPVNLLSRVLDLSKPGVVTAIMSEKALARRWLTPEEDEAWKDL